jgi:hypothetical protein
MWAKEIGSVGTSFAPGTTGIMGGRPRPVPVVRLLTAFVEKARLPAPVMTIDGERRAVPIPHGAPLTARRPVAGADAPVLAGPRVRVLLRRLAFARSGDKGDSSNVALIARRPEYLPEIRRQVTPERMMAHFVGLVRGPVERFEAPGLHAINFLMQGALGGGGIASPRIDPQGKAFGQMTLEMEIEVPAALIGSEP